MMARFLFVSIALSIGTVACHSSGGDPHPKPEPVSAPVAFEQLESRLLSGEPTILQFDVVATGAVAAELTGSLKLDGENGPSLDASGTFGGKDVELALETTSDQVTVTGGQGERTIPRPEFLDSAVVHGLTRMGILHNLAMMAMGSSPPDHSVEGGIEEWIQVKDVRWAETNGVESTDTLEFGLLVSGESAAKISLRLGPDGLPIERKQTVSFPEGTMVVVETYERIASN